jgi:hypothetical protein
MCLSHPLNMPRYLSCLLLLLATLSAEGAFAPLSVRHGLKLPSTTPTRSAISSTSRGHPLVTASTTQMWAVQDDDDENENQNANTQNKKKIVVHDLLEASVAALL